MQSHLFHLHALSALHVGTGQGVGVIDQPIARERASQLPYVPGSGLKGVLREETRPLQGTSDPRRAAWIAAYGPEQEPDTAADRFQGALTIGDALLLCLPVRSLAGGFAWATCPLQLLRYQRDASANGESPPAKVPEVRDGWALPALEDSCLKTSIGVGKVALEEFLLNIDTASVVDADAWAKFIAARVYLGEKEDAPWPKMFRQRFVILADAQFDFLAETATEVRARIKIDQDKGTAAGHKLWYEENLPAESILWGVLAAHRSRDGNKSKAADMLRQLPSSETRVQLGGKATVGHGIARFLWGNPAASLGVGSAS